MEGETKREVEVILLLSKDGVKENGGGEGKKGKGGGEDEEVE